MRRGARELSDTGKPFALHKPLLELSDPALRIIFNRLVFVFIVHRFCIGSQARRIQQDCFGVCNCVRKTVGLSLDEPVFIKPQKSNRYEQLGNPRNNASYRSRRGDRDP
jgi:hypothetical protein